ncbi:armadillo-type protein [Yarrowia lipolytica]|nr:armadillo-type protein [Yarrowia lipolytica]RDW39125.1 armadillo-type protein [Yarrowia lipolytica]VBB85881.1 Conserved hypothetical protein [Yarrowia lipolytica]
MTSIKQLLLDIQAPDNARIKAAEAQLDSLSSPEHAANFALALISESDDGSNPSGTRQLALQLLRRVILKTWSIAYEEFGGYPLPEDVKSRVKTALIGPLLADHDTQNLAAQCLAKIAFCEFPDEWPTLIDQVVQLIESGTAPMGGLQLLKELFADTLSEIQFFGIANQIMTMLHKVVASYPRNDVKCEAVAVLRVSTNFFAMTDTNNETVYHAIQGWCQLFVPILQQDINKDAYSLNKEIVLALQDFRNFAPKPFAECILPVFQACLETLQKAANVYRQTLENPDDELVAFLAQLLLFIDIASSQTAVATNIKSSYMEEWTHAIHKCATLSGPKIESWEDFNVFVTEESDLFLGTSLRYNALQVIETWCEYININWNVPHNNWLDVESWLYLCNGKAGLPDLVAQSATSNEPILRARAYLCDPYTCQPDDPSDLAACASLLALIKDSTPDVGAPTIVQTVARLAPDADDDTPAVLCEALVVAVRKQPNVPNVIPLLFDIVEDDVGNVQTGEQVTSAIDHMSRDVSEQDYLSIAEQCAPYITKFLNQAEGGYTSASETAMDVLTNLVNNSPTEVLPHGFVNLFFPALIPFLRSGDADVLQSTTTVLQVLVERASAEIAAYKVGNESGGQVVVQYIAHLLNPALGDNAPIFIGKLITTVIDKYHNELGAISTEILDATARRLGTADKPLQVTNLILVFCHFIEESPESVVNLLADMKLETPKGVQTGLEALLKNWFEKFIYSSTSSLPSVTALGSLFKLQDPRIMEMIVDGRPLPVEAGVVVTRSMAKRMQTYEQISAQQKIIEMLIEDLKSCENDINRQEQESNAGGHAVPVEEVDEGDDEWEELDGLDELVHWAQNDAKADLVDNKETMSVLKQFFQTVAANNVGGFYEIWQRLTPQEQAVVENIAR